MHQASVTVLSSTWSLISRSPSTRFRFISIVIVRFSMILPLPVGPRWVGGTASTADRRLVAAGTSRDEEPRVEESLAVRAFDVPEQGFDRREPGTDAAVAGIPHLLGCPALPVQAVRKAGLDGTGTVVPVQLEWHALQDRD